MTTIEFYHKLTVNLENITGRDNVRSTRFAPPLTLQVEGAGPGDAGDGQCRTVGVDCGGHLTRGYCTDKTG